MDGIGELVDNSFGDLTAFDDNDAHDERHDVEGDFVAHQPRRRHINDYVVRAPSCPTVTTAPSMTARTSTRTEC
jgi:hypothetical protein